MLPTPYGNGVIARAHTEATDGGHLLPGYLDANDLDELRAMLPPGLRRDGVFVRITAGVPGIVVDVNR